MRVVIEVVTCDKCGEVRQFEKYNHSTKIARIESLTQWLQMLGWSTSDGLQYCDLCPECSKKKGS